MSHFAPIDYTIFIVYLIASVLVGVVFVKEQRNLSDYFLAGRSMSSAVVAISVLAALFSGISYLGAPGEVYAHDLSFVLVGLSFFIATPVTTLLFLPFFYQKRFFTAYQFLEERFSPGVRTLSSSLFIIRAVIWLALATYAPALALQQVTGFPLWATIVLTGVLTTIYTTIGGMKAVIWTDVMQFVVLFGGQIIILVVATMKIPGGVAGAYQLSHDGGKLALSFDLDPRVRITIWGLLIGGAFTNLVQMATDQVSVQRYLTATDLKAAQKSLWIKLSLTLPVIAVFYVTGAVLYAFYSVHGDPLAAGKITKADQILPYFVINELPAGMPGVLIAAIYAASMSTISAGINALTTATVVDILPRMRKGKEIVADTQIRLAKWMTLGYGALVLILAFVVQRLGSLLEASNMAVGVVGGPLLGLFLLGALSKRTTTAGALVGWGVGVAVLLPVTFLTTISFMWYATIGCVVTVVVAKLYSMAFRKRAEVVESE